MIFRTNFNQQKPSLSEALTLAPLARQHPRYRGCVGHWAMVEGGGDKLVDLSGSGNAGTLTNMDPATDWLTGRIGHALDFDGSSNYVNVGDPDNLYNSSGAMSFWLKTSDTGIQAPFGVRDSSARTLVLRTNFDPLTGANNSGEMQLRVSSAGDAEVLAGGVNSDTGISDGEWHHLGVVWDWSNTAIQVFVDGVEQSIVYFSQDAEASVTGWDTDLLLGAYNVSGTPQNHIHDTWDDFRMHNRAPSSNEMVDRYSDPWAEWVWAAELMNNIYMGKAPAAAGGLGIPIASYHYEHHLGR